MKNLLITTVAAVVLEVSAFSSYGFEREYVKHAVLSKEQEKVVIALAQKCGIKKIATISTHNLYPTAARGIRVKGVEQVKGREVSFKVLNVTYNKWFHPGSAPRKADLQMGDFWAGKPGTQKQTILKLGKKEYRAGSVQGISIEACESILGLFLAGEYNHGPGVNDKSLNQIDWSNPNGFRKQGDMISVGFPHKNTGSGFFDLYIKLDGQQMTIDQIFQAVP